MAFKTKCPNCGQHYELEDEYAGMPVECTKCKKGFLANEEQQKHTDTDKQPEQHKKQQATRIEIVGFEMSFRQVLDLVLKFFLANLMLAVFAFLVCYLFYGIIRSIH